MKHGSHLDVLIDFPTSQQAKGIGGSQKTSKYGPQCGQGWQEHYARLHDAILQDEPTKQRFAVVELHRNGLGDRLTSAVGIFYYALLSGTQGAYITRTRSLTCS